MLQASWIRVKGICHVPALWWGAALWLFMLSCPLASAATIQVPDEHQSIQAAIDAAVDGDIVLVAPGRYNEVLDLGGKAITLKASGAVSKTVIDGSFKKNSVIRCVSGEGRDTVIDGFTITSGTGDPSYYGVDSTIGGGLLVMGSKPIVRNCVIRGNNATYTGGGMYNGNGADVLVEECTFSNNSAGKRRCGLQPHQYADLCWSGV